MAIAVTRYVCATASPSRNVVVGPEVGDTFNFASGTVAGAETDQLVIEYVSWKRACGQTAALLSCEVANAESVHGSNANPPAFRDGKPTVTMTGLSPHISATNCDALVPGPFSHWSRTSTCAS